jgi:hypothetical protein
MLFFFAIEGFSFYNFRLNTTPSTWSFEVELMSRAYREKILQTPPFEERIFLEIAYSLDAAELGYFNNC